MKQEEYASRANSPHLCSSTSLSTLYHVCLSNTPLCETGIRENNMQQEFT